MTFFPPVLSPAISTPADLLWQSPFCFALPRAFRLRPRPQAPPQKERGSNLRWSPSTVGALPGMCPNRSSGRDLVRSRPRENLHVVGALRVFGDVQAFAFHLDGGAQADDHVDDLVEDRRTDTRPHQRGADAPELRGHLRDEIVVGDLAGGVVHDAGAT